MLLFGNCQLQRASFLLRHNGVECSYVANTEHVDEAFRVDAVLEAVSSAPVVIAQPIFNQSSPLFHESISRLAKEVVYVPYVYIDGLFSLDASDIGSAHMLGADCLSNYVDGPFGALIEDFLKGRIDFQNQVRLDRSLAELQRREKAVDAIEISDVIAENWRRRPLMLSHNHPEKWLFGIMVERLLAFLGHPYRPYASLPHYQRVDYMFSKGEAVQSPYDVDRLSLNYESDDQWWTIGNRLLTRFWDRNARE